MGPITSAVQKYAAGFEGRSEDEYQLVHFVGENFTPIRTDISSSFDEWIHVRYYMEWNTPGESDGVLMIWQNDELTFEDRNFEWFSETELRPNGWWIGGNYSGGGHDPLPFQRLIDDVYVAVDGDIPDPIDVERSFEIFESNSFTSVLEGDGGDSATIALSQAPQSNVTLQVDGSVSDRLSVSHSTLTFTPENWNIPQTLTFTSIDDDIVDVTEQVAVNLTVTDNSDSQWRGVTIDPIFVTLEDNDVRQDIPGYQYGVYVVPGDANESFNLDFIWQQRLGSYDNELGFFIADDVNGTVNGILPTEPTYSQVALSDESNQVIFASGQGAGAQASFSVPGGSHVVFYMVQDLSLIHI